MKAIGCDVYNFDTTGNIACCLTANSGTPNTAGPKIIILNDQGGSVMNVSDKSMTLRAEEHGHQPVLCMPMTFQGKAGSEASLCIGTDIAPTLRPAIEADVVYSFEPGIMRRDCSAGNRAYKNICSTLRAQMGDNQPAVCFSVDVYNMQTSKKVFKTLNSVATDSDHIPVICLNFQGSKSNNVCTEDGTCYSINAMHGHDSHIVCYGLDQQGGKSNCGYAEEVMPTLCSDSHGTPHAVCYGVVSKGNGDAFLSPERHMSLSVGGGQAGQGYPAVCYEKENYSE